MAELTAPVSLRNGEYTLAKPEPLGRGATAAVYQYRSHKRASDVAVKVLAPTLATRPGFTEQFLGEFRRLAQLIHPDIIHAYDFGLGRLDQTKLVQTEPIVAVNGLPDGKPSLPALPGLTPHAYLHLVRR
jgi:serine/threonine protein kinase